MSTPLLRADALVWRIMVVVFAATLYLVASLAAGEGELVPPLDDTYIHLQYARNLAHGDLFTFNPGGPYSTGDTSPAYVVLLAPAFWLGLDGSAALWWVFALSALLHFTVVSLGLRLVARWTTRTCAHWATLLLLGFWGPWAWGTYLGMEVALAAALLLVVLLAGEEASPRWRGLRIAALAVLPLVRPEGLFLSAIAIALQGATHPAATGRLRRTATDSLSLLPFAIYLVANRVLTGTFETAGYLVKAVTEAPDLDFIGIVGHLSSSVVRLFSRLFLSTGFEYLPPLALLWMIAALAPRISREWRTRRTATVTLVAVWWVADIGLTAMAWFPDVHRARYLLPLFPLYLIVFAAFLGDLVDRLRPARPAFALTGAVLTIAFGANSVQWAERYAADATEIARVQVRLARWLADNTPPGTIVGVHDAGALVYLSELPAVDIVGLGTGSFARPFRHGQGSVFEELSRLPADERPVRYAVAPSWFSTPAQGEVLARAAVARAEVIPEPTFFVYDAVPHVFDEAAAGPVHPNLPPPGWSVVADIDVADVLSEEASGYHNVVRDRLMQRTNFAETFSAGGREFADGGRLIFVGETFHVSVEPDRPAALIARVADGGGGGLALSIFAGDLPVSDLTLPEGQSFGEVAIPLPDSLSGRVEISVRPRDGNPYKSFHYWVVQPDSARP